MVKGNRWLLENTACTTTTLRFGYLFLLALMVRKSNQIIGVARSVLLASRSGEGCNPPSKHGGFITRGYQSSFRSVLVPLRSSCKKCFLAQRKLHTFESPGIFILLNCCVSGQEAQLLHFNASACVHGGVKTFDTSAGIALMFFFTALQAHTNITSLLRRTNLLHCWSNTLNHQQGQSLSAGKSAKVCSLKNSPSFISPQNTPPSVKDSCSHREQPHKRGPIGFNTLVDLYSRESGCCLSVPPLLLCLDLPRSQGCPCVLLSRTQKHAEICKVPCPLSEKEGCALCSNSLM